MNTIIRLAAMSSLLIFFSGCHEVRPGVSNNAIKKTVKKYATNIRYVKDTRTGLCFGAVSSAFFTEVVNPHVRGLGVTLVPCDAVPENFFD